MDRQQKNQANCASIFFFFIIHLLRGKKSDKVVKIRVFKYKSFAKKYVYSDIQYSTLTAGGLIALLWQSTTSCRGSQGDLYIKN